MLRRLFFDLRYLRRPPWDSGIAPPELMSLLEHLVPGRALDMGCGTGTSSLAMARAGWSVTGVDFAWMAIRKARRKAKQAGLDITFLVADVTHLHNVIPPFDLVLDIGCFHGLRPAGKSLYLSQLPTLLSAGGYWFLYAFLLSDSAVPSPPGVCPADLEQIQTRFDLLSRQSGSDRGRPSAYFLFRLR